MSVRKWWAARAGSPGLDGVDVRRWWAGSPGLSGVRGLVTDVGLAVVSVVLLAFTAYRVAGSWGGDYWPFGCAAGAVVGAIALARRRGRAWAAVAGFAVAAAAVLAARFAHLPAEPGPAMAVALAVLVGSAVRTLPVPSACAVAAGGLAVAAGSMLSSHSSTSGVPSVMVLNVMGWLAALAAGLCARLIAARRRAVVEEVRRDERLELARELHDVLAHHVTGIVLRAQAARLTARRHPETVDGSLADIEAAGSGALAATRRVVGLLRDVGDGAPARLGLEGLAELVARFDGRGPEVRLRAAADEAAWPPGVAGTVYRIVQEALTNVARHAPRARSVTVGVEQDGERVTVEVVDDGPPVFARRGRRAGYGLVGMRERVEALGGTLRAGPRPGNGWSVSATLPVRDATK
ncbi:sensor histidine kinase [Sphaerisporangium fuscum]|uniref:sensor histidine kinase n=1 Tax=Sphaerisporangium fuscum TaxID=2835868 RepID=UPI0027E315C3|nr:sensor histidine kinase [Sphaerisporangium fuscum]